MRPEFDTEVVRLECGSNVRVLELGFRGKGSLTWAGKLTPEDGRSMLLRNARTHRARLKATTPCRPDDVSKDGGAVICHSVMRGIQFSILHNTNRIYRAYIGGKSHSEDLGVDGS